LNRRDFASINELIVLSNSESKNAEMITKGVDKLNRFKELKELAEKQLTILAKNGALSAIKRLSSDTYLDKK
jgi:hypothetical protein